MYTPVRQLSLGLLVALGCVATAGVAQTLEPLVRYRVDSFGLAHITVKSQPSTYHVLFARNASGGPPHPVDLALGALDSAVLFDRLLALPAAAYTVRTYSIDAPGDVDRDGRDDLAEWHSTSPRESAFNAARVVADPLDGTLRLPTHEDFVASAIASEGVFTYLAGAVFTKVYLTANRSDTFGAYFQNVRRHERHEDFAAAVGLPLREAGRQRLEDMRGTLVYHPEALAPNGVRGLYTFQFQSFEDYDFATIERTFDLLGANMPFLRGNLAFRPLSERARDNFAAERAAYAASRVVVVSEEELLGETRYIGLHAAVGYGILRRGDVSRSPTPYEIVIYDELPNALPRVGGILTTVAQTPLSHVNLRAIQDGVPNAFVRDVLDDPRVVDLLGRYVRLEVRTDTFLMREATLAEVDAHFETARPQTTQRFRADLSLTRVVDLDEIGFADGPRVGAKAANLAELRRLGFPASTDVPDGYAIPFSFYEDFLRHNGLDREIDALLADERFRTDFAEQERRLADLRRAIRDGSFSPDAQAALSALQQNFPAGTPIRCRSSTNGEDLPGFSGAGLYDSRTQHPDEGHIAKSIKQVYASLWNFRAFVERDFYRVEQRSAVMGVLVHPNFEDERVNGVGVSFDPLYSLPDRYYLNAQIGEHLVTNPAGRAVPEELFVRKDSSASIAFEVLRRSNLVPFGERVLERPYINALRERLREIHAHFERLYAVVPGEVFAMEIEFKVDRDGRLAIKQARPWAGFRREFVGTGEPRASQLDVAVYPNPFRDQLSLKLAVPTDYGGLLLELYDAGGRRLVQELHPSALGQQTLRLSGLDARVPGGPTWWVLRAPTGELLGRGAALKQ